VLAAMHAEAFAEGWSAEAFVRALSQPGAFGCIALDAADEPLGFAVLRAALFDGGGDGGEAEVLTIATRPQARRQGVARALMDAALSRARGLGVARVFLEVAADNPAARGLYEGLGFQAVGVRKGYYARQGAPRADAHVLALDLDG